MLAMKILVLAPLMLLQEAPSLDSDWVCPVEVSYHCTQAGCAPGSKVEYMLVNPSGHSYSRCKGDQAEQACSRFDTDYTRSGAALIGNMRKSTGTFKLLPDLRFVETGPGANGETVVTYGTCSRTLLLNTVPLER
jgi:hypothetical protein